jgi:plastocyanin domain-containing protein
MTDAMASLVVNLLGIGAIGLIVWWFWWGKS